MTPTLQRLTLPGPMLKRGFWLYVWRAHHPKCSQALLYVGRTGDNSTPNASAPYTRMGQHLGTQENQSALRNHLDKCGLSVEVCTAFDLIAHGPIYPEVDKNNQSRDALMEAHKPLRNQVGAMEKLLCDGLKSGGYKVMNTVKWRWKLSPDAQEKWDNAKRAFQQEFPNLV